MNIDRIIGRHTGQEHGPLLICLGGMHGNEPAGIQALETLFPLIEREPTINPAFTFRGRILGLRGNTRAIARQTRFIERDLNRMWTPEGVEKVKSLPIEQLSPEEAEIKELITLIEAEIADYRPRRLVMLDLHTTTAYGGIFSISTNDKESVLIGVELNAPVIRGMLDGLSGTTLHYFNSQNMGVDTVAVTFESGQHNEPLSVNRAMAAIINCMRTIGCVRAEHVENRHDDLLIQYSKGLPKVFDLLYAHSIAPDSQFKMHPGFRNFQAVKKGTLLAQDVDGPILAQSDGHLLMPLYQAQGEDGFFLIRPVGKGVF